MMDLWATRTDTIRYLATQRPAQIEMLNKVFDAIDECVDAYESASSTETYARVCGLTLLKAKNLGVAAYSLILDGLAQEAGALMRPFIEYTELLTYFRLFPSMVEKAADNDLPSAGERAKAVKGIYKEFRQHLNSHASHSSYSPYSLAHLLEPKTFRFKKQQRAVPEVIDRNLRDFVIQLYLLLREATRSLEQSRKEDFDHFAGIADDLRVRLIEEFSLNAVSSSHSSPVN